MISGSRQAFPLGAGRARTVSCAVSQSTGLRTRSALRVQTRPPRRSSTPPCASAKRGSGPGQSHGQGGVLPRARAGDCAPQGVVAQALPWCGGALPTPRARARPPRRRSWRRRTSCPRSSAPTRRGPGSAREGGGRPVAPVPDVAEGMPGGQGRLASGMVHQGVQLTPVGQPPVRVAPGGASVQLRHQLKGLGPREPCLCGLGVQGAIPGPCGCPWPCRRARRIVPARRCLRACGSSQHVAQGVAEGRVRPGLGQQVVAGQAVAHGQAEDVGHLLGVVPPGSAPPGCAPSPVPRGPCSPRARCPGGLCSDHLAALPETVSNASPRSAGRLLGQAHRAQGRVREDPRWPCRPGPMARRGR